MASNSIVSGGGTSSLNKSRVSQISSSSIKMKRHSNRDQSRESFLMKDQERWSPDLGVNHMSFGKKQMHSFMRIDYRGKLQKSKPIQKFR